MAGSLRKDGDTWYYVLETTLNGKRKQIKRRGFKSKKEAHKALAEAEIAINNDTYNEPSKMLYKEYLDLWMNDKRHSIGKETFKINESYLKTHIVPALGDVLIAKINTVVIQNFVNGLLDKGLASSTVIRIFNIVNTSLNKAERLQLISKNYAGHIEKPKIKRKELQVWSIEDVKKFLQIAKKDRLYIAFHLALMTGMRQGEILGLRWKDIDFEQKIICVKQTLSHDGKEIKQGAKTLSSIRTIAFDDETVKELKRHYEIINDEKVIALGVYTNLDLVICTHFGTPNSPRNLLRTFYRILETINLTKLSFYDLRHTHATLLLSQKVHPKIVSERLGHSRIQMTLDTYSHLLPNMQSDAAQGLGDILFGNKQVTCVQRE